MSSDVKIDEVDRTLGPIDFGTAYQSTLLFRHSFFSIKNTVLIIAYFPIFILLFSIDAVEPLFYIIVLVLILILIAFFKMNEEKLTQELWNDEQAKKIIQLSFAYWILSFLLGLFANLIAFFLMFTFFVLWLLIITFLLLNKFLRDIWKIGWIRAFFSNIILGMYAVYCTLTILLFIYLLIYSVDPYFVGDMVG